MLLSCTPCIHDDKDFYELLNLDVCNFTVSLSLHYQVIAKYLGVRLMIKQRLYVCMYVCLYVCISVSLSVGSLVTCAQTWY